MADITPPASPPPSTGTERPYTIDVIPVEGPAYRYTLTTNGTCPEGFRDSLLNAVRRRWIEMMDSEGREPFKPKPTVEKETAMWDMFAGRLFTKYSGGEPDISVLSDSLQTFYQLREHPLYPEEVECLKTYLEEHAPTAAGRGVDDNQDAGETQSG